MADEKTQETEGTTKTPEGEGTTQTGSADQSGAQGRTYTQAEVDDMLSGMLTQEQFNKAMASAKKRERAKYEGSVSAEDASKLNDEIDGLRTRLEDLAADNARLKAEAERRSAVEQVASEVGVPSSVVAMLGGNSTEDLARQAKALRDLMPAYPTIVDDGGVSQQPDVTLDDIRKIQNPTERIRARAEYIASHKQ